uniref:Uncharacterized protein n=1 Tax=Opuntia streptacantha TaxID=393608 RepID=A0A7C9DRC0_OPUST
MRANMDLKFLETTTYRISFLSCSYHPVQCRPASGLYVYHIGNEMGDRHLSKDSMFDTAKIADPTRSPHLRTSMKSSTPEHTISPPLHHVSNNNNQSPLNMRNILPHAWLLILVLESRNTISCQ